MRPTGLALFGGCFDHEAYLQISKGFCVTPFALSSPLLGPCSLAQGKSLQLCSHKLPHRDSHLAHIKQPVLNAWFNNQTYNNCPPTDCTAQEKIADYQNIASIVSPLKVLVGVPVTPVRRAMDTFRPLTLAVMVTI
ncbi:MAG: hypothetical protein WAM39_04345 [Bryobacteraceae bacterium]